MEASIIGQENNTVIGRNGSTPDRLLLRRKVAQLAKTKETLVAIQKIENSYGARVATIHANIYSDENTLKTCEEEYLRNRVAKLEEKEKKALEEKAKAESAKQADPEQPAEEKEQ